MCLNEAKQQLVALVKKYDAEKEFYSLSSYNEAQLRTDFLDPFFSILGWDIGNSKNKRTSEREVIVEESLRARASVNIKKPDYTFRLNSQRKFFVEAKKPNVQIKTDSSSAHQVRRYGFTAKLNISVLSNFEYLAIYDCSEKVDTKQDASYARVRLYNYKEYIDKFDEIIKLLGKESVYSGSFDEEWVDISEKIDTSKQTVDNVFFEQIKRWRYLLGENLIKANPNIPNFELNDVIQDYINSIIFLRVCEDRNIECYESLLDVTKDDQHKKFKSNLEKADKKYNSGLFKLKYIDQLINSPDSNLWIILKELYYPYNSYSFSVLSSDLLGSIYEQFLGEELILEDNQLILRPKDYNLNRDIISTPNFIIRRILDYTVSEYCKDKDDIKIYQGKFSDIACGSGAFLLEVYQRLQDILVDYYVKNDKNKLQKTGVNQYKLYFEDKKTLLLSCIWGIDKDFNAVKACRFGLLLKLLEQESDLTIQSENSILPDLSRNILWGNSLIEPSNRLSDQDELKINPLDLRNYKFDIIVGNPPYLATEYMKSLYPEEFEIYKEKYFVADKQFDKYYLFIERAFDLLNNNGLLGYIIPSKFVKLKSAEKFREFISLKHNFLFRLISFGSNQLFKNKSTYTSIAIFNKSNKNKLFLYQNIRDYKKWFDSSSVNDGEEKYVTVFKHPLSYDTWYLQNHQDELVLNHLRKICSPLEEIIGSKSISNGVQTSANSQYIHTSIDTDEKYIYFLFEGKEFKIEKELTKPYFKTDKNTPLYTFRNVQSNSFLIYPYSSNRGKLELLDIMTIKHNYPYGFNFLMRIKSSLLSRNIFPPITENDWYKYGRHQALENCNSCPKIIVGILSKGYKYSIDHEGVFISSGGTAGYSLINIPANCLYSIYYIQAVLSSKYSEWLVSLSGEIFEGGFIARGTKVQKQILIPNINFNNKIDKSMHDEIALLQKNLNDLFSKIEKANERDSIRYERMFESKKRMLDEKMKELYNLGELDDIVPSIENLYS
ncbi:Eco57I restriction-modification methylase domain-containing protein [Actinobacillus equuli]|uniref:site-specific DNA-methyltransferase (adenine-specific) n=2 Tax=Actinobacillus equuli TaxID=718 RepID=A0AAX3FKV9_ACTEU|nr:Eco57I restriction-modification methylase domain-containing protein [Actinobacillus equuli]AIZ78486.1 adenine methyltransferase [Actinobacillus equuli subsp. equuli]WGE44754.1 Eco57I restriction-modification methylase domain-containing protein [Actinobacillus equuli subsp. equuli]VEE92424.1 Type IIS restriction enzyme Eco57I [Actinobacillus equuli]